MISEIKPDNLPFPYSKRLYSFVRKMQEKILYKDRMVLGIIWGDVGSGKSIRAQEIFYLISGDKCHIDKIAFDKSQFVKAVLMAEKEAIIGDEGISIFFSRGAMSKEGRLMAELMNQIRQKNLVVLICIPDVLAVDSMVLSMANFIGRVWESEKKTGPNEYVTIKGNMAIWPKFRHNNFKDRMIRYLKIKRSNNNPFVKVKMPRPWHLEPGGPITKKPFYAVSEKEYKDKKESILNKYREALERKKRNTNIDYVTMDKLLRSKVTQKKIAEMLNVSVICVKKRSALVSKRHKQRRNK